MRSLTLVDLSTQLSKRAIRALLPLTRRRRRSMEVRRLGLSLVVRMLTGHRLLLRLRLLSMSQVRRVLDLVLRGVEMRRETVLGVLIVELLLLLRLDVRLSRSLVLLRLLRLRSLLLLVVPTEGLGRVGGLLLLLLLIHSNR